MKKLNIKNTETNYDLDSFNEEISRAIFLDNIAGSLKFGSKEDMQEVGSILRSKVSTEEAHLIISYMLYGIGLEDEKLKKRA